MQLPGNQGSIRTALALALSVLLLACGGGEDADRPNLELVGHTDLGARGMNSAIAIAGDHVYIGSRTDSAGVLIVDISDPTEPTIVGEIGVPDQGLLGVSSRELRTVPSKNLLIVLNMPCFAESHLCVEEHAEPNNFKFYDISTPSEPVWISTMQVRGSGFLSNSGGHEFFVWHDPQDSDRVLLYASTPGGPPGLQVYDISDPTDISRISTWDMQNDGGVTISRDADAIVHSISVSADGTQGYLSGVRAGLLVLDTSDLANQIEGGTIELLAPVDAFSYEGQQTHSAAPVPGRDLLVLTDEVYPAPVGDGCPWGWTRLVDISTPSQPRAVGEFRIGENDATACPNNPDTVETFAYTAHNPTATSNLAFVTWYTGGLRAIDISAPETPVEVGTFMPEPLPSVAIEDPRFGGDPVMMWSYPIIRDGLIYVSDSRNGLYILRYNGPHADEVDAITFLEGNSNR